jgi:hypothetical protein
VFAHAKRNYPGPPEADGLLGTRGELAIRSAKVQQCAERLLG